MNLSKTQLRSALRLYTSSWRYLYGVKPGATRVDLDGKSDAVSWTSNGVYARKQLEEARRFRHSVLNSKRKREAAAAAGEKEDAPRRERKPRPTTLRRKEGAERKPRAQKP